MEQNQLSKGHKVIVKNTFALYIRMFITMGISIYTTRIVLEALGITDYGIFNVVGGLIAIITTVTGALTIAVQRFLNFEQGKEKESNLSQVFSSSVFIHLLIALAVFIILETIGLYYFRTVLNIPPEKYNAAIIVYHLCSISACITLATAPFSSLIISFERMDIFAYLSVADVVFKLGIVYFLLLIPDGRLILYAQLTLCVSCLYAFINWLICRIKFSQVRIGFKFDKSQFLSIFSFASWSAFGQIAWAFTLQGTNILLNIFFGPVLNAAYGITSQVHSAVQKFVQSFQTALNPPIIKSYAKHDVSEMISLLINGSKYSCLLLLLIIVPLFYEMDNILAIWLKEIPAFTAIFCRLMLINIIFDTLSNLIATAFQAYGRIRKYQLVVSAILILNFPLSYLILRYTGIPYLIYGIYGVVSISLLCTRLMLMASQMKIKLYREFLSQVIWPLFKVLAVTIALSTVIYRVLNDQMSAILQIFVIGGICLLITLLAAYYLGLKRNERDKIHALILSRIKS